jgi:hypothetical protein
MSSSDRKWKAIALSIYLPTFVLTLNIVLTPTLFYLLTLVLVWVGRLGGSPAPWSAWFPSLFNIWVAVWIFPLLNTALASAFGTLAMALAILFWRPNTGWLVSVLLSFAAYLAVGTSVALYYLLSPVTH